MAADPDRQGPPHRAAFVRFVNLATRWSDNDAYGHLNNVVYYTLFDSAVNAILIEAGLLDPVSSLVIGLVVESNCRFYASLTYPEPAEVGVAVEHLGRSSVRYHLAVFKAGAKEAAAAGRYTHVYVERATNRPVPIPEGHRRLMEGLMVSRPQLRTLDPARALRHTSASLLPPLGSSLAGSPSGDVVKVRNSLKSLRNRHRDNRLVRRKGRVYIINKTQKRYKARQG